jgi:hypothetical protein
MRIIVHPALVKASLTCRSRSWLRCILATHQSERVGNIASSDGKPRSRSIAGLPCLTSAPASNIAVVFIVARNSEYAALKKRTRLLDAPNTPGLELPDMDIVGIATSYGIPTEHVEHLSDLTRPTETHSHPVATPD